MNPRIPILPKSSRVSGFTLTELLVVIVIVIVLASVSIPIAGKVKANSEQNKCTTQLRSWGITMAAYSADNGGKVEWRKWPSISWDEPRCSPYVHYWSGSSVDFENRDHGGAFGTQLQMRTCPSVKWNPRVENSHVTYATIKPVGVTEDFYPLSKIRRPSRFMLMVETTRATSSSGYSISSGGDFTSRVRPLTVQGPDNRHDGSVNALMADFSVKEMKWKEIQSGLNFWNTF